MTPRGWASMVLAGLGAKPTQENLRALVGWARIEGGHYNNSAKFNLLNTTLPKPGSSTFQSVGVGSAPIRIYKNWAQGIQATIDTLKLPAYRGVVHALRQGKSASAVADAVGASPWGTSAAGIRSAIGATPPQSTRGLPTRTPGGGGGGSTVTVPGAAHAPAASTDLSSLQAALAPQPVQAAGPLASVQGLLPKGYTPAAAAPVAPPVPLAAQLAAAFGGGLGPSVAHPSSTVQTPDTGGAGAGGGKLGKGHSPLFELFWQGEHGINVKHGQHEPQGFVSGHTDHVHVAAGPKTIVQIGHLAQRMGLHVGENPHFGGVNPVHVPGSYHYRNEAIDVSKPGDPALMAKFAHTVARLFGVK